MVYTQLLLKSTLDALLKEREIEANVSEAEKTIKDLFRRATRAKLLYNSGGSGTLDGLQVCDQPLEQVGDYKIKQKRNETEAVVDFVARERGLRFYFTPDTRKEIPKLEELRKSPDLELIDAVVDNPALSSLLAPSTFSLDGYYIKEVDILTPVKFLGRQIPGVYKKQIIYQKFIKKNSKS